jgi:hypothetical protein
MTAMSPITSAFLSVIVKLKDITLRTEVSKAREELFSPVKVPGKTRQNHNHIGIY